MPRKGTTIAPQLDKLAWIEAQLKQALDEDARLDEIIGRGVQYKTTATGFPALIFETCSCKTYADRRSGHAQDCTIEAVTDPGPIVAAMREKRLNRAQVANLLSLRDEMQTTPDQSADIESAMTYIEGLHTGNESLRAENESLRRQLESAYAEMRAVPADVV